MKTTWLHQVCNYWQLFTDFGGEGVPLVDEERQRGNLEKGSEGIENFHEMLRILSFGWCYFKEQDLNVLWRRWRVRQVV